MVDEYALGSHQAVSGKFVQVAAKTVIKALVRVLQKKSKRTSFLL